MPRFVTVAALSDLPAGRPLTVQVDGIGIAIFQWEEELFALKAQCPHRGGPLGEGCVEHGHVYCPMHGWQFELRTGACRENPERPARRFPVRVLDGEVQVDMDLGNDQK